MNRKLSYLLIVFTLLMTVFISASAQMGIGTTTPDPSAALDIVSTTQGVLHPRLTTAQRDAISSPAEGLTLYNTTDKCLQSWDGTAWKCAVGGSSGTGGGTTYPAIVNNSIPQVYAVDDNRRFYDSKEAMSMAWIDNNTFAIFYRDYIYTAGTNNYFIGIYNANFGTIREFSVPTFQGVSQAGYIKALKNGNLLLAAAYWTQNGGNGTRSCINANVSEQCVVFAIVDQQGNTVKSLQKYLNAGKLNDMQVMDNGNFYLFTANSSTPTTYVFNQAGTQIKQNSEPAPSNSNNIAETATTDFGYVYITPEVYRTYNFSGTLISNVNNWFTSPNGVLDAAFTYYNRLTRIGVSDNTLALISKYYGIASFVANTSTVSLMQTVLFSGTYQNPGPNVAHPIIEISEIAGGSANGTLLYLAQVPTAYYAPIGVLADGTPHIEQVTSLPFYEYDLSSNQLKERLRFAWPPGSVVSGGYTSSSSYALPSNANGNYPNDLQHGTQLAISPDRKHALVKVELSDFSVSFTVQDITDLNNITQVPYIAARGTAKQTLGKAFQVISPLANVDGMQVQITNGYKSGDTLSSVCSPASVNAIFVGNTLAIAGPGAAVDFTTCLNEMVFKTTAAAGPRTIALTATDANGVVSDLLSFTLNVGP